MLFNSVVFIKFKIMSSQLLLHKHVHMCIYAFVYLLKTEGEQICVA